MCDTNRSELPVGPGQDLREGQQGREWALKEGQDLRAGEKLTPLISREHLFQEL